MERRNPPQVSAGLHISLRDEDDLEEEEEEEEEYDNNESELVVVDDEWVPLQSHPAFSRRWRSTFTSPHSPFRQLPLNYMAWDSNSQHLYVWDPKKRHLFCLTLRFSGHSIEAASKSKILHASIDLGSMVRYISLNRTGDLLLLAGSQKLFVMYLHERSSIEDGSLVCRTITVGGSRIFVHGNSFTQILQASWHPCSDTHLGVLSSDSLFRLFDLSTDLEQPEQEFYLQAMQCSKNALLICLVAFSFGGEHLWDRFAIFFLFSDGSIYVLCPIVPFGSIYSLASIQEIYKDAHLFGLRSSNSKAVNNASLALNWLESTFPELANKSLEGGVVKAHPYVPIGTSLSLQGPLCRLCSETSDGVSEQNDAQQAGRGQALAFFCNTILKDTIIATAWSSGLLEIDALADELQPVWNYGSSPRLRVDDFGCVIGVAMICEQNLQQSDNGKIDQLIQAVDAAWMGYTPPLFRLAILDLSLMSNMLNESPLLLVSDPLILERIYYVHGGGVDSIILHFLPFSDQVARKDATAKAPTVTPIISTFSSETYTSSGFLGFVTLADAFGNSWILSCTYSFECFVIKVSGMDLVEPFLIEGERDLEFTDHKESSETGPLEIMSKELLKGPKDVPIPMVSASLRSLPADSIEGRAALHHYFKLFHEKYVEYAHKVYVSLKYHGAHLKKATDDQQARLKEVHQKLVTIEESHSRFKNQLKEAFETSRQLEVRLQRFRSLPGVMWKPLTNAEKEFKAEIERFTHQELDELRSSVEALEARLHRYLQPSQASMTYSPKQTAGRRKAHASNAQVLPLKTLVERLSQVSIENSKKVELIEGALQKREGQEQT
ncbi:nuclear pore complex protein NUP88 isoform X1 [Nymphaea colorata]|uniref:nuclear pore complex protein NUP88 isoform X1 n=1 Tax=Nymphaea colorata TaxID=210225 RepID=UPI00129DE61E|nr:nuclear pore complex protein NUP88 isoform X1 [Nymphaea colorata]